MMRTLILHFLLLFSQLALSQYKDKLNALKAIYPNQSFVISELSSEFEFKIKESKPVLHIKKYTEHCYFNERSFSLNLHNVKYSASFEKVLSYKAYSYIHKGSGKYKKQVLKDFRKSKEAGDGIFYDDLEELSVRAEGITEGSFSNFLYEGMLEEVHLTPSFYFMRGVPVFESKVSISFPKEMEVKVVLLGDSSGVAIKKVELKDKTILTYSMNQAKEFDDDLNAPSISYYLPHIVVIPLSYTVLNKKTSILSNSDDLYKWYYDLTDEVNKTNNEEIVRLSDSLVKNEKDTLKKAAIIYEYVQKNIKYIAFEDGLGGFIPRPAELVLHRKYGDCKDKSSLLYSLLRSAGINAHLTWIGSRDIPYSYNQIHSPACDNHMIASFYAKGTWHFLDGTSDFLPFDFPTSMIQGKEAMIGIDSNTFRIITVPIMDKNKNNIFDTLMLSIDKDIVSCSAKSTYTGYIKQEFAYKVSGKRIDDLNAVSFLFSTGNNKFKLKSLKLSGLDDNNADLIAKYDFEIPNYVKVIENENYLNLNLDKYLENQNINLKTRIAPYTIDFKSTLSQHIELEIPDGYELMNLPSDHNYSNEILNVTLKYSKKANKVCLDKTISVDQLLIEKNKLEDWNEIITNLNLAYKEVITLKKNK